MDDDDCPWRERVCVGAVTTLFVNHLGQGFREMPCPMAGLEFHAWYDLMLSIVSPLVVFLLYLNTAVYSTYNSVGLFTSTHCLCVCVCQPDGHSLFVLRSLSLCPQGMMMMSKPSAFRLSDCTTISNLSVQGGARGKSPLPASWKDDRFREISIGGLLPRAYLEVIVYFTPANPPSNCCLIAVMHAQQAPFHIYGLG